MLVNDSNKNVVVVEVIEAGERFINLTRAIYTQQSAKVKINGELTKEIQLQKGTRQGCPLSMS